MEASIPVVMKNSTIWVNVRSEQQMIDEGLKKTVTVNNSPLKKRKLMHGLMSVNAELTDDSLALLARMELYLCYLESEQIHLKHMLQ